MSADVWNGCDIDTCFGLLKSARAIALHKIRASPSPGWTFASLQSKLARLGLLLEQVDFSDPGVQKPQLFNSRLGLALDKFENLVLDGVRTSTEGLVASKANKLGILTSLESTKDTDELAQYLYLEQLQDDGLANDVLDTVEGLLDALEHCERNTAPPEPIEPHERANQGDGDPWSILFNHLSKHVITCPTREESHPTKLFLGALADQTDALRLLCSHSDGERWHTIDFHIQPPHGEDNARNVQVTAANAEAARCTFCDLLMKPPSLRAHKFIYNSREIWHARQGSLLDKERRNPRFQSLETWLLTGQATRYRKTLQCILAQWLGHLYGTPWLPQSWALESIWMDETLAKDSCRTPYARCRPWQSAEAGSLQLPDAAFMIRFAILMLRIEFPKYQDLLTIENEDDLDAEELDEQLQTFLEDENIGDELEIRLKQVLQACQEWDGSSLPERRVVFDKIFAPLEEELMSRFGLDVPGAPERITLPFLQSSAAPSKPEITKTLPLCSVAVKSKSMARPVALCESVLLYDDHSVAKDDGRIIRAETYFELLDEFLETHTESRSSGDRVKIAVLDTGVNEKTLRGRLAGIKQQQGRTARNIIVEKKSFVTADSSEDDRCGHGTRVLDLLLRSAPNANFYIAKISATEKDNDPNVARYVIEALDWAIEKQVDLINMSFGFKDLPEDGKLQMKLREAYGRGIKMFAAAANHGKNAPRAFPANAHEVICINASCGSGSWADEINPSSTRHRDKWNTLGVGIKFDENSTTTHRSGTSYATPLAVGTVATAISFVRHLRVENHLTESDRDYLETYDGIWGLMELMSDDSFIAPWIFWDKKRTWADFASRLKWRGR